MKYMHVMLGVSVLSFMYLSNNYNMDELIKNDLNLVHYTSPKAMQKYLCKEFSLHQILLASPDNNHISLACLISNPNELLNAQSRLEGMKVFLQSKPKLPVLAKNDTSSENFNNESIIILTLALGLGAFYYGLKPKIECIIPTLALLSTYCENEEEKEDVSSYEQSTASQDPQKITELLEKAQKAVSSRFQLLSELKQ